MNKMISEFLVGLTVLLGLAGVSVLLLLFGEITGSRVERYPVYLQIADASGLTTASRVTLNGVPIGIIRAIRADADPRLGVIIELGLDARTRIPRDVSVSLERGLVGEATLAMRTSPLRSGAADPGHVAAGETLRSNAAGVMDQISALLDDKLSAFADAAEDFRRLSESFARAGERLNDVLAPRTPAEVDEGAAANLVSTIARFDDAVRSAGMWLGDDAARGDAKASIARFRELLDRAAEAVESWNTAAGTLTRRVETLGDEGTAALRDFAATARTLNDTALEVQSIAAKINRGEGTAGLLVNNPDLYRSLNDAANRLEKSLTEAQLLLEKYRKEGIPLRF